MINTSECVPACFCVCVSASLFASVCVRACVHLYGTTWVSSHLRPKRFECVSREQVHAARHFGYKCRNMWEHQQTPQLAQGSSQ